MPAYPLLSHRINSLHHKLTTHLLVPNQLLLAGEVAFWRTALLGVVSSFLALALTVGVDSYFWRTLVWPEGMITCFRCLVTYTNTLSPLLWSALLCSALFIYY